ncbi:MAG: hypothetical protein ACPGWR_05840 [Ardenticatenaceae bacterium]
MLVLPSPPEEGAISPYYKRWRLEGAISPYYKRWHLEGAISPYYKRWCHFSGSNKGSMVNGELSIVNG